jgi:hypothetical protein
VTVEGMGDVKAGQRRRSRDGVHEEGSRDEGGGGGGEKLKGKRHEETEHRKGPKGRGKE